MFLRNIVCISTIRVYALKPIYSFCNFNWCCYPNPENLPSGFAIRNLRSGSALQNLISGSTIGNLRSGSSK